MISGAESGVAAVLTLGPGGRITDLAGNDGGMGVSAELGEPIHDAVRTAHVLVLNDDEQLLALLRDVLEDAGYRVSTGLVALGAEDVAQVRPDLVVLDLVFGGEERGGWMLRALRDRRTPDGVPVVVCTAAYDVAERMPGISRADGVGLVLKPFDLDDLLGEVAAMLAWAKSRPDSHPDGRKEERP